MKKSLLVAGGMFAALNLSATPIEITRFDGQAGNGAAAPWKNTPGLGAAFEDNETEPRTLTGDIWDLEAMVYDSANQKLSLIGTFDFQNGVPAHGVTAGAIFLKAQSSATWSYAYVLNFGGTPTYSLYNNFTTLAPTDVAASGPWMINTATANLLGTGEFVYNTGVVDPFGLGLQRESGIGHNQLDLMLGLLPDTVLDAFDAHYTMSCGNDTLEGRYTHVPDSGATALLFLSALSCLGVMRRKPGA